MARGIVSRLNKEMNKFTKVEDISNRNFLYKYFEKNIFLQIKEWDPCLKAYQENLCQRRSLGNAVA